MAETLKADVLIIGAGLAGITVALELLDAGKQVLILDRDEESRLGGLANEAFGGMALCGTTQQRLNGIKDSPDLMLRDWLSFADFTQQDKWPYYWAQCYAQRNHDDVYRWLKKMGVGFFPAVNWVERGEFMPGNSVPRYHIVWGTGWQLVKMLVSRLRGHKNAQRLQFAFHHRVDELLCSNGSVTGVRGVDEQSQTEFEYEACVVVVATGGVNGNLGKVRENWPKQWGQAPAMLLNGSHQYADGLIHDAAQCIGANITHLDWQWNYAAGIQHPQPRMPYHGLSLIPPKSALWMDAMGRRIGPCPLVTGFDTHGLCQRISHLPHGYSWQVMNRKIARKEISISGSEHNSALRDRKLGAFLKEILLGNDSLYDYLVNQCPDVVTADTLEELGRKMNEVDPQVDVDISGMIRDIKQYDSVIERGETLHNDDQLRRIEQVRRWRGDKVRTLKYQKIDDPKAGPFVAIRECIISRKSMGGIQTDDHSRVLSQTGKPFGNLYAVGEAAGFGGGGANGNRALEGTFLSLCILTGRIAGRSISGQLHP